MRLNLTLFYPPKNLKQKMLKYDQKLAKSVFGVRGRNRFVSGIGENYFKIQNQLPQKHKNGFFSGFFENGPKSVPGDKGNKSVPEWYR